MAGTIARSTVDVGYAIQRWTIGTLQSGSNSQEAELPILYVLGFLGGLVLIYSGFGTWRRSRLFEDTPTSRIRSMSVGQVELTGSVRKRETAIPAPLVGRDCVYVDWHAEKREYRPTDKGDDYEWVTIARGTHVVAFDLEDDTGSVLVRADADDPEFDINRDEHRLERTYDSGEAAPDDVRRFVEGEGDPTGVSLDADEEDGGLVDSVVDFAKDVSSDSLDDTGNRRRYSETVLPTDDHAFVFGSAQLRDDAGMEESEADLLEVRRHEGTDTFLISDSTEDDLQDSYGTWAPLKLVGGLLLSAGCLYLLTAQHNAHQIVL